MIISAILADGASNNQLGVWVSSASIVLNIILAGLLAVKMLRNDAEKREVVISPDVVAKPDFIRYQEKTDKEIDVLHTKIGSSERESRKQSTDAARELNGHVMKLAESVGKVVAVNEIQNQTMIHMSAKLDRIAEKNPPKPS